MSHLPAIALSILVAASTGACSEETEADPEEPESAETEVPRMQLMLMFQSVAEFCLDRVDSHERACVSEEVCQGYCDRMLPEPHTDFMAFPCGGQHTEICYEASRPAAGSPAFAAAQAAGLDEPASECWQVTSQRTGKSALACGPLRLTLYWASE
jgi:hypothetical protein